MINLNENEKIIWSHIIKKHKIIDDECTEDKCRVCERFHKKLIRDEDGIIKEVIYKCNKQLHSVNNVYWLTENDYRELKLAKINFNKNEYNFVRATCLDQLLQPLVEYYSLRNETKQFAYVDLKLLFEKLSVILDNKDSNHLKELLNTLKKADLLVIVNVGFELKNSLLFEWMSQIIIERQERNLTTILASNYSQNDLKCIYADKGYNQIIIKNFIK